MSIEAEDIPLLLRDVARFAEAVEKLKDVVLGEGGCDHLIDGSTGQVSSFSFVSREDG